MTNYKCFVGGAVVERRGKRWCQLPEELWYLDFSPIIESWSKRVLFHFGVCEVLEDLLKCAMNRLCHGQYLSGCLWVGQCHKWSACIVLLIHNFQ